MLINKHNKVSSSNNIKENYQYKVSIIVPCYNTKPWLDECLQSLVDQTLQDIEIICINDGSTDGTGARLDDWQTQYPDKIKVIHQSNGGSSNARNAGMAIAQGECIGFVDSDDFVDICMYEKLYKVLKYNNADIIKTSLLEFNDGKHFEPKTNNLSFIEAKELKEDLNRTLFTAGYFFTCGYLYKKLFLDNNNIKFQPDITFMDDYTFSYDVVVCNPKIFNIEDKLYYYRQSRLGKLTLSSDDKLYDIFKVYNYTNNEQQQNNNKTLPFEVNQFLLKTLLSSIPFFIKKININEKIYFFLKCSICLFSNYKVLDIYKNSIKIKRKNILNYLLAHILLLLLHIYYFSNKLFFIIIKKSGLNN